MEKPKSLNKTRETFNQSTLPYAEARERENKRLFEALQKDMEFIEKRYGTKIEFATKNFTSEGSGRGEIKFAPSELREYRLLVKGLREDFGKIPPDAWRKLQIGKIVCVGKIIDKDAIGIIRADRNPSTMYISERYPFFHEMFHRVDYLMGTFQGSGFLTITDEPNEIPGGYQNHVWDSLDPNQEDSVIAELGGTDEEQAHYCSKLFRPDSDINDRYTYLKKIDPKKIEAMKYMLNKWSNGQLDEQFWEDSNNKKVGEDYWQNRNDFDLDIGLRLLPQKSKKLNGRPTR